MDQQKAVTIKDIANYLGVSLSTVNKALTGKGGISEQRRKEIIITAKEMGYRVNHVAQSLSRKQLCFGVVFPSHWGSYWEDVQIGMDKVLAELAPYNVICQTRYINSASEMEQAINELLSIKVDALIIFIAGFPFDKKLCEKIDESKIPVFISGDDFEDIDVKCTISVNSLLAGNLAANMLKLMIPKGAKVAAFIGSRNIMMHAQKEQAFVTAMKEHGNQVVEVFETHDDDEIVQNCITQLLSKHPDVQGVYIASASGCPILKMCGKLPQSQRPVIIATDVYGEVKQAILEGVAAATIYQNQELMGRLTIKIAYEYLCAQNSYCVEEQKLPRHIRVNPRILLKSSINEEHIKNYYTDTKLELSDINI